MWDWQKQNKLISLKIQVPRSKLQLQLFDDSRIVRQVTMPRRCKGLC